jgi:hypothetical protein
VQAEARAVAAVVAILQADSSISTIQHVCTHWKQVCTHWKHWKQVIDQQVIDQQVIDQTKRPLVFNLLVQQLLAALADNLPLLCGAGASTEQHPAQASTSWTLSVKCTVALHPSRECGDAGRPLVMCTCAAQQHAPAGRKRTLLCMQHCPAYSPAYSTASCSRLHAAALSPAVAWFGTVWHRFGLLCLGILTRGLHVLHAALLLLLLCSEWETRSLYNYMMRELAGPVRGLFMDVHSGMWALMSPW